MNRAHDIARALRDKADELWLEPGMQGLAQFLEMKAAELKLFADIIEERDAAT